MNIKLKALNLPKEEKFIGNGISYCAMCDGALYKNRDVVVLGSNESAINEAKYLSNIVRKVTLISNKNISFESDNIEFIDNKKVKEFIGDDNISGLILEDDSVIECDGVFIYYGYSSEVAFLNNLDITDTKGYIIVDENMKSNINFVYACGDIIKKDLYQVSTAVSEGAIAAVNLNKELNGR